MLRKSSCSFAWDWGPCFAPQVRARRRTRPHRASRPLSRSHADKSRPQPLHRVGRAGAQGIWRPIYLEYWSEMRVSRATAKVLPRNAAGDYFPVETTMDVHWAGAASTAAVVNLLLEETGLSFTTDVTLQPGVQQAASTLAVPAGSIQLWYRSCGPQPPGSGRAR